MGFTTYMSAQMARMIHKELADLFLTECTNFLGSTFISIAAVDLGKDLGVAKVYLSFSLNDDNQDVLFKKVVYNTSNIRRLLGKSVAHKMRKIPDLRFYMDNRVTQGAHITALIDQLT